MTLAFCYYSVAEVRNISTDIVYIKHEVFGNIKLKGNVSGLCSSFLKAVGQGMLLVWECDI